MAIRIGVLTGGGDCPGLNPAIKWVVKTALDPRLERERHVTFEVLGIREGWRGIADIDARREEDLNHYIVPLDQAVVRTWDRYGGTNLGTSRTNPFDPADDRSERLMDNLRYLNIEALVAIGGEDTLGVAHRLSTMGVKVVGIPKTIDKDLSGTDYTLGFESAVQVITEEIDRLRTTAGSHRRIFVVETMGRHSGWLALEGGEASGAYMILIPEYEFEIDRVNDLLLEGRALGNRYEIVVVAEGAKPKGGTEITRGRGRDGFGHVTLGGVGEFLAAGIERGTGLETRSVCLSHLQRGGAPCAYDRRMGRYFGIAAVDLIVQENFGKMVSFRNGQVTAVSLEEAVGKINKVDVRTQYDTERYNGRRTLLSA
ncbi:MAG: ATP-dependent 6-phosphofructokinase [Deltaproteobacteria bacterium]|nr:ATP-dependent 6-phosphofructokinase [Deltaproteobacteria bacterium]MBW2120288.1 ATP-dependent 6-phosphofructokinase [Deltaproteobacteria bacterium]